MSSSRFSLFRRRAPSAPSPVEITPAVERRNGRLFIYAHLLTYFSAPVIYVGLVQAAFCDKLGASATVANLPSATYLLGSACPILCAWFFPARHGRRVAQTAFLVIASSMLPVCLAVFLPFSAQVRIAVVIAQGLVIGIINSVTNVYMISCLAHGTTEKGRLWALKYTFGLGPLAAVSGSLGAQALLRQELPGLPPFYNFGVLYLITIPCMFLCAFLMSRLQTREPPDEARPPLRQYLVQSVRELARSRNLVLVWWAYFFWYATLSITSNLSLYTKVMLGRAPLEVAGLVMAVRFGCKALAGFGLASLAARFGGRISMIATILLFCAAVTWPFVSSGYVYLLAFGLMGAGELGGVYIPNFIISISEPKSTTRNLALLSLVAPLSSFAPALYGGVTDTLGFKAGFIVAGGMAAIALVLVLLVRPPAKLAGGR